MKNISEQLNELLCRIDPAHTFCNSDDGDPDEYWSIAAGSIEEFELTEMTLESVIVKLILEYFSVTVKFEPEESALIHGISEKIYRIRH